ADLKGLCLTISKRDVQSNSCSFVGCRRVDELVQGRDIARSREGSRWGAKAWNGPGVPASVVNVLITAHTRAAVVSEYVKAREERTPERFFAYLTALQINTRFRQFRTVAQGIVH